jgi:hypothetical protein
LLLLGGLALRPLANKSPAKEEIEKGSGLLLGEPVATSGTWLILRMARTETFPQQLVGL